MPTRVVRFNQPAPRPSRSPRPRPTQRPGERRGTPPTPRRGNSPGRYVPRTPSPQPGPGPIVPPSRPFVPVTTGGRLARRVLPWYRVFRTVNTVNNIVTYVIGEVSSGQTYVPGYYIEEACAAGVFRNNNGLWSSCGSPAIIAHPEYSWQPDRPNVLVTWADDLGEYEPNPSFHIYAPGTLYRKMDPDPFPGQRAEVQTLPGGVTLVPHPGVRDRPRVVPDVYPHVGPVAPGRPNPQPRPEPRPRPDRPQRPNPNPDVGTVTYVNPTPSTWSPPGVSPTPGVGPRPGNPPVVVNPPVVDRPHRPQPPRPREKEKKGRVARGVAKVAAVAFEATETLDLINSLWDALPKSIRDATPKTGVAGPTAYRPGAKYHSPQDKARAVYRHMDKLDIGEAVKNIIKNQIEDAVLGRLNRGSDAARRRAGGTAGWGMVA